MRAREFPVMLFEVIRKSYGSTPLNELNSLDSWRYFGICGDGGEPYAHVGLNSNCSLSKHGQMSRLNVWGCMVYSPVRENEGPVKLLDPLLEIVGGPHDTGDWSLDQGSLLEEGVTFRIGENLPYCLANVRSPLVKLVGQTMALSHDLINELKPVPLSYWEAFKNPQKEYAEPDKFS